MKLFLPSATAPVQHPEYALNYPSWREWRTTYLAGTDFIDVYLQKYSNRESDTDFEARKQISYVPAFASSAVNEVRNAIFERMNDITREGGDPTYKTAIDGHKGGVNKYGCSMTNFMGTFVLPELLVMAKVGIYIDMPVLAGESVYETKDAKPYLYIYPAEQILSWDYDDDGQLESVFLVDLNYERDPKFNLPNGINLRSAYRHLYLNPEGKATVDFYNDKLELQKHVQLNVTTLPFVIGCLSTSLLTHTSKYQIAHMNAASSDINYIIKSNFPFYVEQDDARVAPQHGKEANDDPEDPNFKQQVIGPSHGRVISPGVDFPRFIAPPSEPLKVSMEKQEIIKKEIRLLVHLSISNLQPSQSSAESKAKDASSLEAGLSYIGDELQKLEQEVAKIWAEYVGNSEPAYIAYPTTYSLRTDDDRLAEADAILDKAERIPSLTAKKALIKRALWLMVGNKVKVEEFNKMVAEIDALKYVETTIKNLQHDVELGITSRKYAAEVRGYPEEVATQAEEEHVRRAVAIADAQNNSKANAARGVKDLSVDPKVEAESEKEAAKEKSLTGTAGRGEAK